MLKMRLQRIGRKNDPSFRVVVTESTRGPKSGKHVDLLGSYNPKLNQFQIDSDRAKDWIAKGVQVSDTVHNLLVSEKILEGKKINVLPRKSPQVTESAQAEEVAPAESEVAAEEVETPASEAAEEPKEETPAAPAEEEKVEEEAVPKPAPEAEAAPAGTDEVKEEEKAEKAE